jgi:hypothetical protein
LSQGTGLMTPPQVPFRRHLIRLARRIVDHIEGISGIGTDGRALAQGGQGSRCGLAAQISNVVLGDDVDLDSHQKRTQNEAD